MDVSFSVQLTIILKRIIVLQLRSCLIFDSYLKIRLNFCPTILHKTLITT